MKCPQCHQDIAEDSRFCRFCGATVSAEPPGAAAAAGRGAGGSEEARAPSPAPPSAGAAASHADPAAEQPVWSGRPSWRAYVGQWALWLLWVVVLGWLAWSAEWFRGWWAFLLAVAAGLALVVRQALAIYSLRYRLTTQRMFFERGLLSRISDQTELVRIDDVRVRKSLLDRIVGTGTVEIVSTDQSDKNARIAGIHDPDAVGEEIRRHTRRVRSRQTLFVESV